jgi:hypothetical protein
MVRLAMKKGGSRPKQRFARKSYTVKVLLGKDVLVGILVKSDWNGFSTNPFQPYIFNDLHSIAGTDKRYSFATL